MPRQIQGSQRDFSFGEIDLALKRADDHPARKGGLRQMSNARILNSGAVQNRSGRRALYPAAGTRTERFTISAGNVFDILFGAGRLQIIDSTGTVVGNFTTQGSGAALPWTADNVNTIVYAIINKSICVCFGHAMRPQIVSWDGVSAWSIADYTELLIGSQKRTPFYRISPQGIAISVNAISPTTVCTCTASAPVFTAAHVGTRIRYIGRQILITGFTTSTEVTVLIEESLPSGQGIGFTSDPRNVFGIGDVVIGSSTGSKGIVTDVNSTIIIVQLLSQNTSSITSTTSTRGTSQSVTTMFAFTADDTVAGPGGALAVDSVSNLILPRQVPIWDDEVMNDMRGYPASCFVDQFRLGFCDFPAVPGGIAWSVINTPADLYVGPNPTDAMFEIAPDKVQVRYVMPGPESSEFVFCDSKVYYIPISETNPLKPGSVAFKILSGDGSARVQPRVSQETIIYANAGQTSVMAIIASGAYLRPFNTKNLSDFHGHLFSDITAIAVPNADGAFNERYAYVLNGDGSIAVGKYNPESLQSNLPVIGWGPWSGSGSVQWIAAHGADVIFTSGYQVASGTSLLVEVLDDAQYLDCSIPVNAVPAIFTPPSGKGPLWFFQFPAVTLIDQGTRVLGTYLIDANGFIIPQFNGGEDLTRASLIAGQPWSMITEPFAPDAQSGADMHQRMMKRRISNFAAYVVNSTGFTFQKLFSRKETLTSPALGTPVSIKRVPAWNMGEDAALPPKQRETMESWRPSGHSFDPRVAIIKDSPGPLQIVEIGMEITL